MICPGVPVTACASILPSASKTAAERSPDSRTMGVKDVRWRVAACSLATVMRRVHRICNDTGSMRESVTEGHFQVPHSVDDGGCSRTDDDR